MKSSKGAVCSGLIIILSTAVLTPELVYAGKNNLGKDHESKGVSAKKQKLVDIEDEALKGLLESYVPQAQEVAEFEGERPESFILKPSTTQSKNQPKKISLTPPTDAVNALKLEVQQELQEEVNRNRVELKRQKLQARKQKKLSGIEQPELAVIEGHLQKNTKAALLSLDGGGIRGYMSAIWLDYIYNEIGKHDLHTVFDFIGGTSIGGISSLGLTAPDETQKSAVLSTRQLVELFEVNGGRIFPEGSWIKKPFVSLRNLFRNQYDASSLEELLKERFEEKTLKSLLTHTVVTSVDAEKQKPYNFTTRKKEMYPCKLWEVGRATSAAPTYFTSYAFTPPKKTVPIYLLDGGLSRNNPAALVATEAFQLSRDVFGEVLLPDDAVMLSLGTGRAVEYVQPRTAGKVKSILPTIETLMNTCSEAVHESVRGMLPNYLRMNPTLERSIELDKVKPANMRYMKKLAEDQFETLDKFIQEDGLRQVLEQGEKRLPRQ